MFRISFLIGIIFISLVFGEGGPPPPPCKDNGKKDCSDDITCAWCLNEDRNKTGKCVDWNPCTNSSDDCPNDSIVISDKQSDTRKNQCDGDTIFVWIIVILIFGGALFCLAFCIFGIYQVFHERCCPNYSFKSTFTRKRQNYNQINSGNVQLHNREV